MISERVLKLGARINASCARSGRSPGEITLVAVAKGRSVEEIKKAAESGILNIGENRVQEAFLKYNALGATAYAKSIKWHMVGHLQTNKAKDAVGMFDLIHSVDSLRLAKKIDEEARAINKVQEILLEVKTSQEHTKYGIAPQDVSLLVRQIYGFKNIALKGFMTVAALTRDPEKARPYFRQLRELQKEINASRPAQDTLKVLSMGMSDDFEVAIEEGATLLRIGRAIFES